MSEHTKEPLGYDLDSSINRVMPGTFLTDEELIELTGVKRKSNQIRWLTQHRYPHETNANGAPKVLRCYLERRLGESAKSAGNQPNFGALRKAG